MKWTYTRVEGEKGNQYNLENKGEETTQKWHLDKCERNAPLNKIGEEKKEVGDQNSKVKKNNEVK